MNALRLGSAVRAVRLRRRMRQVDVALRAGVSQPTVSRLERGHLETLTFRQVEAVCSVLEIRLDLIPRWRGGDLDRMLNARHAALHEAIASWFRRRWRRWQLALEVSFAIYGERGVIDLLAWHARSRSLLVMELKTELVDLNELLGVMDRRQRLAPRIGRERGWDPVAVGVWVVVAESSTNRRRIGAHAASLEVALPDDGRAVRQWLRAPAGTLRAVSLETFAWDRAGGRRVSPAIHPGNARRQISHPDPGFPHGRSATEREIPSRIPPVNEW